jgi:hypothetical protein
MLSSRLVEILESEVFLPNYQCGFRRKRSSVDHLVTLGVQARQSFLTKQHLVVVFFVIEKARDSLAMRCEIHRTPTVSLFYSSSRLIDYF